jgi:hypothetical protein
MLLLAAAFAFAACGGDSKEDFAKEADEICKEGEEKIEDLDEPSDLEGFAEFADESVAIAEDTKGELEDLDPPGDVEDDWNRYLDNVDEGIELIQDAGEAAEADDQERFNEIVQSDASDELEEENEEIADEIGFDQCGRGDSS